MKLVACVYIVLVGEDEQPPMVATVSGSTSVRQWHWCVAVGGGS